MKVLTWNINGIRGNKGLPLKQLLDSLDADIICLQETKVTRDQLDESSAVVEGYNSYFSFSRARSGYSGVATFARDDLTPWKAEDGLSGLGHDQRNDQSIGQYDSSAFTDEELMALDREGRSVMTQHRIRDSTGVERVLVIINVYCPRAEIGNEDRKAFKMQFYQLLQARAEAILKSGSHVIVLGDINTSHRKIDHCDPSNDEEFYANPGRKWLDNFLCNPVSAASGETHDAPHDAPDEHHQFIDTFRRFHPDQLEAFTNWCSTTGARGTNYGCRLDYIFADKFLARHIFKECFIMPEVLGSDHCPVKAILDCSAIPAKKCPSLCTKYMPQFAGRQQKLSMFLVKASKPRPSSPPLVGSAQGSRPSSDCDNDQESSQEDGSSNAGACRSNSTENNASQATEDSQLSLMEMGLSLSQSTSSDISVRGVSGADVGSLVREQSFPVCMKRSLSESKKSVTKKSRVESKTVGNQSNLLKFFGKREGSKPSDVDRNVVCNHSNSTAGDCKTVVPGDSILLQESKLNLLSQSEKGGKSAELRVSCQSADFGKLTQEVSEPTNSSNNASTWKNLLKGPPTAPLCRGHDEPCVLRTVKKPGPNRGRQFWTCNRPEGHKTNREARCEYFVWVSTKK